MPSVVDSILGTLGGIAGQGAQRTREGLEATQAHGLALKNQADQILLDQHENKLLAAELDKLGIVRENLKTGAFEIVDIDKLAGTPLAARLFGKEADKFFKTADGVKIAGVRKVPGGLIPNMNPVDEAGGLGEITAAPTGPASQIADKYMIDLAKPDGKLAPATMNASSAADDQLITLDKEQLLAAANSRLARMQVGGAFDNEVTMGRLGLAHKESSDAYLQNMLAQDPDELTGGDPIANRELYGILPTLTGKDLDDAIRAKGLDPDKLREEHAEKWAAGQEEARKEVMKPDKLAPRDYLAVKSSLTRSLTAAEQALSDYDSTSVDVAEVKAVLGPQMTVQQLRDRGGVSPAPIPPGTPNPLAQPGGKIVMKDGKPVWEKAAPHQPNTRAKLVKNLENAKKLLEQLGPLPVPKTTQLYPSKFNSGFQPKVEFTDANLREAAIGKLQIADAEETAKVAQYARDQGVKKAADLAKLSLNDATALATIIAANTQGTSTEKLAVWDKLMNFARTGDSAKSPIEAQTSMSTATAQVTNAGANMLQAQTQASNAAADNSLAERRLVLDTAKYNFELGKYNADQLKEISKANEASRALVSRIFKGTTNDDNTFKDGGANQDAMDAWKTLRANVTNPGLPVGTPQHIADTAAYMEGFFQMAAAQSMVPGKAEWWDFPKHVANLIFREKGMVNMSPLIETARISRGPDGNFDRVSFTAHGGTANEVEMVVGAAEFERFTGSTDFKVFVEAVLAQQAATMLNKEGKAVSPEAVVQRVTELREAAKPQ